MCGAGCAGSGFRRGSPDHGDRGDDRERVRRDRDSSIGEHGDVQRDRELDLDPAVARSMIANEPDGADRGQECGGPAARA